MSLETLSDSLDKESTSERWGGAKWTPDQARYWLPILTESGIEGAIARHESLVIELAQRMMEPGFDIAEHHKRILRAILRAALKRGSALASV